MSDLDQITDLMTRLRGANYFKAIATQPVEGPFVMGAYEVEELGKVIVMFHVPEETVAEESDDA